MPTHRFYCPRLPDCIGPSGEVIGAEAELDEHESRHAMRVLRLREGDAVELFDGAGTIATGRIASAGRAVSVAVERARREPPPRPALTIAAAVPKGPRADAMVEQLSQLGVDRLVPLRTKRSVVDPRDAKLDRYRRAAVESAKQCGRAYVMVVEEVTAFADVVRAATGCLLIASPPDEGGVGAAVRRAYDAVRAAASVTVLIGPEGGWSDDELAAARQRGFEPWPLGPHVMRIETAAAAAAAVVRYAAMGVDCEKNSRASEQQSSR